MKPDYEHWMVRSPQHQITGLFSKDDLITKIKAGEFSQDYEICPGNGYWIYLSETKELESLLGIALPAHLLASAPANKEEVEGEITEDFPEESSRTMQFNPSKPLKPKPVQAPLAPREAQVTPPAPPVKSGSSHLTKLIFVLIGLLAIFLVIKK